LKDLTKGLFASLLLFPAAASAGKQKDAAVQTLAAQHQNRDGAFRFRTPEGWSVESRGEAPEVVEAQRDELIVRFVYRQQEAGFDGIHADCMLERLAEAMQISPQIRYEYDFLSAERGDHRLLDSAFVVKYDTPVRGHKEWRQRNLTIVGPGMSLCVITYCPTTTWKRSSDTRALLDGVVRSVELR
jgi:hypothetical protein